MLSVPDAVIRALLDVQKKIYYYEMLRAVAATFIWCRQIHGTRPIFFEDNTGAQGAFPCGFSSDFTASLLLAVFWGSAAIHTSQPWVARVASRDNPADCLTKDGLDTRHLRGANMVDPVELNSFWELFLSCLRAQAFPDWQHFNSLLIGRYH